MSTWTFARLVPSAGVWQFDRLVDVAVAGDPAITAVGTVRDGATFTITGTDFSSSGNTVFITQGENTLQVPVGTESTTSITTSALDTTGLYLTQSIGIYVIDATAVQSNTVTKSILAKANESVTLITQEFLGDASTRGEATPADIDQIDEIRVKNVVGGTISDVTVSGQAAFSVASGVTSFDYAIFDGLLLGAYATVTWANPVTTALVPTITGLTELAADTAVIAAGFTAVVVAQVQSTTVATGIVAAQFPPAGTTLTIGGVVELTLSLGASGVLVPILTGQSQALAEAVRTLTGLTGTTYRIIDGVNSGLVLNQSIAAGTIVESGAAVDIVVSSNLAPSVVGLLVQQAESVLTAANLTFDETTYQTAYDPVAASGTVLAQSPAAGAIVSALSQVSLILSVGPGVVVPITQVSGGTSSPDGYNSRRAGLAAAAKSISTRR